MKKAIMLVFIGVLMISPIVSAVSVGCPSSVLYGQDLECRIEDEKGIYEVVVSLDGKYLYSRYWVPKVNPVFSIPTYDEGLWLSYGNYARVGDCFKAPQPVHYTGGLRI